LAGDRDVVPQFELRSATAFYGGEVGVKSCDRTSHAETERGLIFICFGYLRLFKF
jgi:hypothetical protein